MTAVSKMACTHLHHTTPLISNYKMVKVAHSYLELIPAV